MTWGSTPTFLDLVIPWTIGVLVDTGPGIVGSVPGVQ